jgi:hypothetical protein
MRYPLWKISTILGSVLFGFSGLGQVSQPAIAQILAQSGECQPPEPNEYLILVITPEPSEQQSVFNLLPSGTRVEVCGYLGETVSRIGGYTTQEDANTWAQSIAAQTGLKAYVTRPPKEPVEPAPVELTPPPAAEVQESSQTQSFSSPLPDFTTSSTAGGFPQVQVIPAQTLGESPTVWTQRTEQEEQERVEIPEAEEIAERTEYQLPPQVPVYNPQPLPVYNPQPQTPPVYNPQPLPQPPGILPASTPYNPLPGYNPQPLEEEGYAVLVDYRNQPQVAAQLQQITGTTVGLATYGQRPYLFVLYTDDEGDANSTLETLSESGFLVMVVDSRQVVLLSKTVTVPY